MIAPSVVGGGECVRQVLEIGRHPKVDGIRIGSIEAGRQTLHDQVTVGVADSPYSFVLPVEGDHVSPVESPGVSGSWGCRRSRVGYGSWSMLALVTSL